MKAKLDGSKNFSVTFQIRDEMHSSKTVLVPLCGKSVDMMYLCEFGFDVVGVECHRRPILEFGKEQRRRLRKCPKGAHGLSHGGVLSLTADGWVQGSLFEPAKKFDGYRRHRIFKRGSNGLGYYWDSPNIWHGCVSSLSGRYVSLDLIHGDYFDLTPQMMEVATSKGRGYVDMVYDRDAIVAIPPEHRQRYVDVLSTILNTDGKILMVIHDYGQTVDVMKPNGVKYYPFSFSLEQLRNLFPAAEWTLDVLEDTNSTIEIGRGRSVTSVASRDIVVLLTKTRGQDAVNNTRIFRYMLPAVAGIGLLGFGVCRSR